MEHSILKEKCSPENLAKLIDLGNETVLEFVARFARLCNPKSIFVRTDSAQDIEYIRNKAVELGGEQPLSLKGHTYHFDGRSDQARDKKNTKYLLPQGTSRSHYTNAIDKQEGRKEVESYLHNIMKGKEMFVCIFCLAPVGSDFSILALQLTDSAYVVHSEDILYRPGYEELKKRKGSGDIFRLIHSAGELENCTSKNIDQRRVYIDIEENVVYSVNTQYAGNTVGLKKLSLRLAIQKASREGWLAEHMFVMGVKDDGGTSAYFCGAYPSMCGKTSTAMLLGEQIVGDDIAYLRIADNEVYAANVERGIFGIIKDVNTKDDPILFKALSTPGEVIFSNVLVDEHKVPYWTGKGTELSHKGVNFAGEWFPGKTTASGEEIPPSHKNSRYTIRLSALDNVDKNLESPRGVLVKGLIYGGRDSDTSVPVEQSFSWQHGIITKGASLESETTAATLGQEGVRVFNPMSNMDFLSIPLARYIEVNLGFAKNLTNPPTIFSVNYFLKGSDGKFLNAIEDKRVWLKWMRQRVDGKVGALLTPTGFIPKYDDLAHLFKKVLGKEYTGQEYSQQFTLRIPENLAKIERIRNIYKEVERICGVLFEELDLQEKRLQEAQAKQGDYISPQSFQEVAKAG